MIRTAISFLVLFGTLFFVSKSISDSQNAQTVHQLSAVSKSGRLVLLAVEPQPADAHCCGDDDVFIQDRIQDGIHDAAVILVALQQPAATAAESSEPGETQWSPRASRPSTRRITITDQPAASDVPPPSADERPVGSGLSAADDTDKAPVEDSTNGDSATEEAAQEHAGEKSVAEESASEGAAKLESGSPAPVELTPELEALRKTIRDVLAYHIERPEAVEQRSPWGIMHALIAYGVDTEVTQGGRRVNAIGWVCFNGPCRGQQLMYVENGRLEARQGPGVQGHEGQLLAMLAQSKVKLDYPIRIDGHQFTIADLVEYEKRSCQEKTELTFKLIALSHYLDTDTKWKNAWGQEWDLPKLIKEELAQPVIGAACGGTHRMMGFSYAVRNREKEKLPVTGQWLRAKKFVDDYHAYTFSLQNDDGSFSTNWFRGPESQPSINRRIETTGHIFEWLAYSLPQEQLLDKRTVKAAKYLAHLMWQNREHEWEIGPKGHALHALAIYDERVFQGKPGQRRTQLAEHRGETAAR